MFFYFLFRSNLDLATQSTLFSKLPLQILVSIVRIKITKTKPTKGGFYMKINQSKYSLMQPRWLALHVLGIAGAVWLGKAWGDSN